MTSAKLEFISTLGVLGSAVAGMFGGFDTAMTSLLIFMTIDYITGLLVAGVFHNSQKTTNGSLESHTGFKGLIRKCMVLIMVIVGCRLDIIMGTNHIKDAVIIAFIVNELISIAENVGLMGVPMPDVIKKAIDVLQTKDKG